VCFKWIPTTLDLSLTCINRDACIEIDKSTWVFEKKAFTWKSGVKWFFFGNFMVVDSATHSDVHIVSFIIMSLQDSSVHTPTTGATIAKFMEHKKL
jgi:hypothetical protein